MPWARGASVTIACRAFGVRETLYLYGARLKAEIKEIADLLIRLSNARKRWVFGLCFHDLRNFKLHPWNHKRVYSLAGRPLHAVAVKRIYCALQLSLQRNPASG